MKAGWTRSSITHDLRELACQYEGTETKTALVTYPVLPVQQINRAGQDNVIESDGADTLVLINRKDSLMLGNKNTLCGFGF